MEAARCCAPAHPVAGAAPVAAPRVRTTAPAAAPPAAKPPAGPKARPRGRGRRRGGEGRPREGAKDAHGAAAALGTPRWSSTADGSIIAISHETRTSSDVARNATIVARSSWRRCSACLSGVLFAYAGDLPQISALDNYSPSTITRDLRQRTAGDRRVRDAAARRRRLRRHQPAAAQAIIATEDADFDRHFGSTSGASVAAAAVDIAERRRAQGASTLTQQVARNLKISSD
jgi:hypothetical protein